MTASSTSYKNRGQGEVDAGPQRRGTVPGQADHEQQGQGSGSQRRLVSTDARPLPVLNAREASPSRAAASGTAHAAAVSLPPDRPGVLTVAGVRGPNVAR